MHSRPIGYPGKYIMLSMCIRPAGRLPWVVFVLWYELRWGCPRSGRGIFQRIPSQQAAILFPIGVKGIFPAGVFAFWGEYYSVSSEIFIIHNIIIMLFHFFGYFYVSTSMSGIHKDVSIFVFLLVFRYHG